MCGIAGMLTGSNKNLNSRQIVENMADVLLHRGPDGGAVWGEEGIFLAHRRLAILDLSKAGNQPMHSTSGRYVLTFNGEIYNHLELREDLESITWRGFSDTETLLAAFEKWGIETTLKRLVGMFAFAVWDRVEKHLILARDRLGEKPLYYGWVDNSFVFASELKAFRKIPGWNGKIDRSALASYLTYSYVPAPQTIFVGINKLVQGTFIVIPCDTCLQRNLEAKTYWSLAQNTPQIALEMSDSEFLDQVETLLKKAVARQMLSDVPVGAFLSGGIDSSTIVSLMQAQSPQSVKTFSIGFHADGFDEAKQAKQVALHLGTEHTELYVTPEDALATITKLPSIYDEPFGDSSGIPTYLVAKLAQEKVTVALSGDGGDELFGGYNRYLLGEKLWESISPFPVALRRSVGRALTSISPAVFDMLSYPVREFLPGYLQVNSVGDKIHKMLRIIGSQTAGDLYKGLTSQYQEDDEIVLNSKAKFSWADNEVSLVKRGGFVERMMMQDLLAYLPDDILTKVDRAAMSVSLETRVPFLDHELVEFALQIPKSAKIRNGQGKWLLRQILYKHVPKEIVERPKQGFSLPLDDWLRGPLREWAEGLLEEKVLREQGFLDVSIVRQKWKEHLSGRRNWQYLLWNVLMWQAWLAEANNRYE